MLLSRDATYKKLEDPPQVIFWHFKAPHIPSKKNCRPPDFSSTPTSNLNYDWSLTLGTLTSTESRHTTCLRRARVDVSQRKCMITVSRPRAVEKYPNIAYSM